MAQERSGQCSSSTSSSRTTSRSAFEDEVVEYEVIEWRYDDYWDEFRKPRIKPRDDYYFQDRSADQPPEEKCQKVFDRGASMLLFTPKGPAMMHQVVERGREDGSDEIGDEHRSDRTLICAVERDEDGVVNNEGGDSDNRPPEHAPIEVTTQEGTHRGKLSASSASKPVPNPSCPRDFLSECI